MRLGIRLIAIVFAAVCLFAAGLTKYSGTWSSKTSGDGGKIFMQIGDGNDSDFSFTINGQEVHCKTKSFRWNGDSFEGSYSFDVEGGNLTSTMSGKRKGSKIEGTYQTKGADGSAIDEGSFTADANQ